MKNPFEICITKITTQFRFSIFEKKLSKTGEKGFVWVSKKIKTIFVAPSESLKPELFRIIFRALKFRRNGVQVIFGAEEGVLPSLRKFYHSEEKKLNI